MVSPRLCLTGNRAAAAELISGLRPRRTTTREG
jgi:hypothetical protein